jgi:hypothetical protein
MTDPVLPEQFRISDVERAAAQERLQRAVRDGQLDLREFDERCAQVWAARTRGELGALTRDLPEPPPAPAPAPPAPRHRVFAAVWACVVAVNVIVWFLVSVTSGEFVYLWPVWLVPSGAVLAVLYASGIGRPRRS